MLPGDPVFYAIAGIFVAFVLYVYRFLTRTVSGFRDGFQDGKN
ncbi:DUF7859 family protein [Salarchaeum japonicum]|uniref:Uncharacterized protein n=1 Tax=Salarchaeum japonicum TaxID=555573 RepID=A0AAV3T058_9EURY|nr:hypothetical protein [Salarchaeum japonicum]